MKEKKEREERQQAQPHIRRATLTGYTTSTKKDEERRTRPNLRKLSVQERRGAYKGQ